MNNSLNPTVPQEVIDYIIASGFDQKPARFPGHLVFTNPDKSITIGLNRMIVNSWFPGDDDRASEWRQIASHENISFLNFTEWAMLLHICGAINLKANWKKANEHAHLLMKHVLNLI